MRWLAPVALILLGAAPAADPPRLGLPIACTLGVDCAVQTYPDDDPGPGVRDYQCHGRSYDRHDGTDFRLTSMARQRQGVAVIAAAPGTVLRARDGVADVSIRDRPPAAGAGQECGNGLVIDHGGGWETQYCHMARGSLAVRPGDRVAAGQALGRVGLSGNTEFPHVHLTVRHDGQAIDPFAWGAAARSCGGGRSLWARTPPYRRGQVLIAGFAAGPVTMARIQADGAAQQPRPGRAAPLVAFVQAIGLEQGDVQRLILFAANGAVLAESTAAPLDRDKAQVLLFAGKKAPAGGWPAGAYRAEYGVTRGGAVAVRGSARITL